MTAVVVAAVAQLPHHLLTRGRGEKQHEWAGILRNASDQEEKQTAARKMDRSEEFHDVEVDSYCHPPLLFLIRQCSPFVESNLSLSFGFSTFSSCSFFFLFFFLEFSPYYAAYRSIEVSLTGGLLSPKGSIRNGRYRRKWLLSFCVIPAWRYANAASKLAHLQFSTASKRPFYPRPLSLYLLESKRPRSFISFTAHVD